MFVGAAVQFALVPVMLDAVGDMFGVWILLAFGLSYAALLERGFELSVNRFVAFHSKDASRMSEFVSTSMMVLAVAAVATLLGAVAISFFLVEIFSAITPEMRFDAQVTCMLVGLTFAVRMLTSNFSGTLRGLQYYTRSNIATMGRDIIRAILTITLLVFWKSIIAIQIAYLATEVMAGVAMWILAHHSAPGLRVRPGNVRRDAFRQLVRFTLHSMTRTGSTVIMLNTLTLLVGCFGTAADVTTYNIAFRLPNFLRGMLASAQNVFLPAVSTLCAEGRVDRIRTIVKRGTRVSFSLACMAAILLFVFADDLLGLWLGSRKPADAALVMRVLIIAVLPGGFFELWLPVLVGMGHLTGLTVASVATAVGAIALATVLMILEPSPVVALAPAVALLAAYWIKTAAWLPVYGIAKLKMRVSEYLVASVLTPVLAATGAVAAIVGLEWFFRQGAMSFVPKLLVYTGLVMATFALLPLRQEAVEAIGVIRRRISRPGGS